MVVPVVFPVEPVLLAQHLYVSLPVLPALSVRPHTSSVHADIHPRCYSVTATMINKYKEAGDMQELQ